MQSLLTTLSHLRADEINPFHFLVKSPAPREE